MSSPKKSGVEAASDTLKDLIRDAMIQDDDHAVLPRRAPATPASPPPALVPSGQGFAPVPARSPQPVNHGMQARPRALSDDPNFSKTTVYMARDLKPRAKSMAELLRVDVSQLVNLGLRMVLEDLEAGAHDTDDGGAEEL